MHFHKIKFMFIGRLEDISNLNDNFDREVVQNIQLSPTRGRFNMEQFQREIFLKKMESQTQNFNLQSGMVLRSSSSNTQQDNLVKFNIVFYCIEFS